nr:60S ribosomal protein L19-like [Ipomoea batatas]
MDEPYFNPFTLHTGFSTSQITLNNCTRILQICKVEGADIVDGFKPGKKGRGVGGCGFVRWFDHPMCSRSKILIPGPLRKINRNDQEIEVLKAKIRDIESTKASNSSVKIKVIMFNANSVGVKKLILA